MPSELCIALFHGLPDLLSAQDAANVLGISAQTVRKMARDGEIPAVRVGERKWIIPKALLAEWVLEGCGISANNKAVSDGD